jgi:iron-sulfur cluster assembly protein
MSETVTTHQAPSVRAGAEPGVPPSTAVPAAPAIPTAGPAAPKSELAILVSAKAVQAIAQQIAKRNLPNTALRVGVKGGGCSGFSYVIEFHDGEPHTRDRVYDLKTEDGKDVRVLVDRKSLIFLNGATLEWEDTLLRRGFKWSNPQEKTSCGCGHSFST